MENKQINRIEAYRARRYIRLYSRLFNFDSKNAKIRLTNGENYGIINLDSNTQLPFGLCERYGIDLPDDAEPRDAWKALAEKGITPGSAYKALESDEGKKKKVQGSSNSSVFKKPKALTDDEVKAKFKHGDFKTFGSRLQKAQSHVMDQHPENAWRVAVGDYSPEDYETFTNYESEGGSVASVKPDGDIVSVCKDPTDGTVSGKDILRNAVLNGGKKLDSFSGNHGFYTKCGFEPVAWCDFDDEYAPDDWKKRNGFNIDDTSWYGIDDSQLIQKREPIIFYRYTGKVSSEPAKDFVNRVPASSDYFAAEEMRDKAIYEAERESDVK